MATRTIYQYSGRGAPDGTTHLRPHATYIDLDTGVEYVNAGTLASPTWLTGPGGGGGLGSVTDGTTTVSPVSSLQVSNVVDGGSGVAVLGPITGSPAAIFYNATDPGAVGAGSIWLRYDADFDIQAVFVRSSDDSEWLIPGLVVYGTDGLNPTPTAFVQVGAHQIKIEIDSDAEDTISRLQLSRTTLGAQFLNAAGAGGTMVIDDGQSGASYENGLGASGFTKLTALGIAMEYSDGVTTSDAFLDVMGLHVGGDGSVDAALLPVVTSGSVDPSAGGGVPAPTGSLYLRTNGEHWAKTGAGDTAWDQMAVMP